MYLGVTESSQTDPVPLYGQPQLVGNSLVFGPTDFGSTSSNLSSDVTDGQLSMMLMASTGAGIQSIGIEESGDFLLIGPSEAFAMAIIATPVFIRVKEIDGQPVLGPMPQTQQFLNLLNGVSPTDGIFTLDEEGAGPGLWSGSLAVDINAGGEIAQGVLQGETDDINALITSAGLSGRATKIQLTLDNKLATASQLGSSADIRKKDFAITLTMDEPVPEPSTLVVTLTGLACLGWAAIRRRKS